MKISLIFVSILLIISYVHSSSAISCTLEQEGELLTNPDDNNSFYQCTNGNMVFQKCPSTLVWVQYYKRCDWKEPEGIV
ncbi:unnamed protein product [Didymodactylos carnosus]|uniref:Chitin-binding type-2 domain-containing protein n=1 Tax=Didymodactylos carnosus TaxID=1234261 RepID=A0A816ECI6_9BILA|nr:unnamed protein product [Didymodactylos carnosus]CAF1645983.1 unnamed protein product [Didymodactylos carnosus]CAF4228467.1 unnamed protein product [Didymodactylos carnosus]CAF4565151.1 unnamed protein product [Didymodactylos carnosus]